MPQAQGAAARFAYCQESTWGTTPGSPTMKLLKAMVFGESLGAEVAELVSQAVTSSRAVEATRQGNVSVKGSVPFELAPLGLGTLLYNALGAKVTSGAGPYTHTLKRGVLPAGLTIEKGFTDLGQYFLFRGCKINGLSLSIPASGFVTGSVDVVGKDYSVSGAQLAAPAAVAHSPFGAFECVALEGGAAATILGMSMNITNEINADDYQVGSRYIGSATEGMGNTTGEVTLRFDSMTTFNKWLNGTASSLKATLTSGANSLEFFFPNITYIGDAIPKIATTQGVIVPLKFRAVYDGTELTDCKVTLINTEATI